MDLLFTATSLFAALLLHPMALWDYAPTRDRALALAIFALDVVWLLVAWISVATNTPRRFLRGFSPKGVRETPRQAARGTALFSAFLCLGMLQPSWLLALDVRPSSDRRHPSIFNFDNVLSTLVVALMRLATLCAASIVWYCRRELHRYYSLKAARLDLLLDDDAEASHST